MTTSNVNNILNLLVRNVASHIKFNMYLINETNFYVEHILLLLSDINECSYSRGGCSQLCINFPGGYNCSCLQGYTLKSDKKSCQGSHLYTCTLYFSAMPSPD